MATERIPSVRISPDSAGVLQSLGLLADLAGTWEGEGFNLIARPDFEQKANLYLQLNQTREHLQIVPIGSSIPNRGFGQEDIELFGLTYLQKINDAPTGGALHIEPGIWVTQQTTTYPPESAPAGEQLIARMGTIPHGNSLLAQGIAKTFTGDPVLATPLAKYNGSQFPSFNSTPFGVPPTAPPPPILNAEGSSSKLTAPPGFSQYDLTVPDSLANPRSPFGTTDPPLPASIDGVPMQDVINDPIKILQATIARQKASGHTFSGTVLNIATRAQIKFFKNPNSTKPTDPADTVDVANGAGGIENILFLKGEDPVKAVGPNAETALVYATFWIERVSHPSFPRHFMQLQYAQMVVLEFEILKLLPGKKVNLGWPHISVATLRKTFS